MTMQISDNVSFNGDKYSLVRTTNKINFNPRKLGLNPRGITTSCMKGFSCSFDITENGIFLEKLDIYDANGQYPLINGISASVTEGCSMRTYIDLHLPIKYTGKILIGNKFLINSYNRDFYHLWYYEELVEFVFFQGRLIKKINHSEIAKQMRESNLDNDYKRFVKKFPKRKFWWIQKWKF